MVRYLNLFNPSTWQFNFFIAVLTTLSILPAYLINLARRKHIEPLNLTSPMKDKTTIWVVALLFRVLKAWSFVYCQNVWQTTSFLKRISAHAPRFPHVLSPYLQLWSLELVLLTISSKSRLLTYFRNWLRAMSCFRSLTKCEQLMAY